jgi:hypothetical protein
MIEGLYALSELWSTTDFRRNEFLLAVRLFADRGKGIDCRQQWGN